MRRGIRESGWTRKTQKSAGGAVGEKVRKAGIKALNIGEKEGKVVTTCGIFRGKKFLTKEKNFFWQGKKASREGEKLA